MTGNEPPQQQQPQPQPPQSNNQAIKQTFVLPGNIDALWARAVGQVPNAKSISLRLPVEKEAAVFTIEESRYWNIFARSTLTLNPETAEIAKWEDYGEQNSGRQLRSWVRYTHTGETGGIPGQIIGFLACIGGAFLVWTGVSLSLRCFSSWRGLNIRKQKTLILRSNEIMNNPIKILGIAGSLRQASYNRGALRAATELVPEGALA